MDDYNKLVKYLDRFCKKTGLKYSLDLAQDTEQGEASLEEIKKGLSKLNKKK